LLTIKIMETNQRLLTSCSHPLSRKWVSLSKTSKCLEPEKKLEPCSPRSAIIIRLDNSTLFITNLRKQFTSQ
jgi:hypothetical protein